MKTLIIAEAGVNHNGDKNLACKLIDAAVEAGADIVKFQTFKTESVLTPEAPKAEYQLDTTDSHESQFSMIQKLELSQDDFRFLAKYCHEKNIEFFSTAFDLSNIDFLIDLGVNRLKVPSGELTNLPYLRHLAKYKKPIILSTGMANLGEIEAALEVFYSAGIPSEFITILHCNTEYPTPFHDVNLKALLTIKSAFHTDIGYSDHTLGFEVSIAAVALGAIVIEKHLTLDRQLAGPDHKSSLEPGEFKAMVSAIRNIEAALGNGRKRPSASEVKNIPIARRSIVTAQPIKKGEPFTINNLTTKRPGSGISPMRWDEFIGTIAKKDYVENELLKYEA